MVFTVPITRIHEISPLFKLIDTDEHSDKMFYMQNPTLLELK